MMPSQANSPVDLAPDVIAALKHYEIRSRLSSDHTGQVFEAWDKQLCRTVVIRQIQHLGAAEEEVIKQARLAASLKHAAFAKIHALEEAGDSLLIVTEAVNGVSLSQWIASAACVEKRVLDHVANIATALLEAHQMGLVHGDLQASQFIVDQSGKIRILNCGFVSSSASYMLGSLDQINARGGIAYLAPERFSNAPASPAADVYALGCLLYEMLNGSLSFAHLQGLAMVAALVQSDPEQWPWSAKLTPATRKLMLAMCQRQPEQRINCAQVLEECRILRANDPYSGSVGSLSLAALQAQLAKAQRRQHFYKLSAAVLALVLLAGMSWQSKPYWPQIVKALTPYSESREMERGIAALRKNALNTSTEQLLKAAEHFSNVLERKPENARAVAYMSLVYLAQYNAEKRDEILLQKAKASVQQAMNLDKDDAIVLFASAKIMQWHHKLESALVEVTRGLTLEPDNLIGWQSKMSILLEMARTAEAKDFAVIGAAKFPDDHYLLDLKGSIDLSARNYEGAKEAFTESLRRQPDSSTGYALLAQALEGLGESEAALQTLQQGLQVRPNAYLYSTLGRAKFARGEFEQAVAAFSNAASPEKGVAGSYVRWLDLGESMMWVQGKREEGISAFHKAQQLLEIRLSRSPDDSLLLAHMSFILARLGNDTLARQYAQRVKMIAPKDYYRLLIIAQSFEVIGLRADAIASIRQAQLFGFPASLIEKNPIFNSLRKDPNFQHN